MIKIYKIIDNTNGNVYIGSTEQKYLSQRITTHRYDYKKGRSCYSKEIIKNGDYKYELIEETDDESRERYYIEHTECVNKNIPGRTREEWHKNNKVSRQDKNKYQHSWGGDIRYDNNNLLKIDTDVFTF